MESRINKILKDIELKKEELKLAYGEVKKKYGFSIKNGKVIFANAIKKKNKLFRKPWIQGKLSKTTKHLLAIPFIYMMLVPIAFLDIFLIIYQNICFRFYGIPLVKRKNFIIFDRHRLDYLNALQKINCRYCSYSNGVIAFGSEVAGRTEKYRCPIKHAQRVEGAHYWEHKFSDYGDPEGFLKEFNDASCFVKKD